MPSKKTSVLVVDDEVQSLRMMQRIMELEGYRVLTASDGEAALNVIDDETPELVLLDIKMPGKSGLEVLQELRATHPDTAVIMVTAVDDVNVAVNTVKQGAFDYVNKPFKANELVISVERALERRRLILENRDYQFNLEKMVAEQTQLMEQKVRELTALNNLFVKYLNQGFESAERYGQLATGIIEAAEKIQALAKEAEARKVEVQAPPEEQ